MKIYTVSFKYLTLLFMSWLLAACAVPAGKRVGFEKPDATGDVDAGKLTFRLPLAWGGDVHCASNENCLLVAVEHEESQLVLIEFANGKAVVLDRQPLAYHPDSAIWLSPNIVVAAVETGGTLDFFAVENKKLVKIGGREIGFSPRDAILVKKVDQQYTILATPYSGENVAWVTWDKEKTTPSKLDTSHWCEAPWHPVHVKQLPKSEGAGIAVACLDDKKVIAVPASDLLSKPRTLATFDAIPRQARPSPSGRWLYVALETGGKNVRIDMRTGELQQIAGDPSGASSVLALADDLVIWGDSQRLTLQKLDAEGKVVGVKEIKTSGYSTDLQLHDINRDGIQDLLVLNSAGETSDVIFGPLWKD